MTRLFAMFLFILAVASAACGSPGQSDRGPATPIAPSCDDIARDVTDLYERAGRVNGHKAELLADLRGACPTWSNETRACVSSALKRSNAVQLEDCGVGKVEFILSDE